MFYVMVQLSSAPVSEQNRTRATRNARPHDTQDTCLQDLLGFHAHLQSPLCLIAVICRSAQVCADSSRLVCALTVGVFVRQPVVLVAMQLKVGLPSAALLLPRVVVDVLALVGVAHLELIGGSHTGAPSVGWSEKVGAQRTRQPFVQLFAPVSFTFSLSLPWIVTVAGAKLHPSTAGARALAELAPRAPGSILFYDVRGQPDAVTFKAVLDKNTVQVEWAVRAIVPSTLSDKLHMRNTFPFPHMVPSMGGPFLVLQKKGLSGWLHHSCLHGSNVRYCRGQTKTESRIAQG